MTEASSLLTMLLFTVLVLMIEARDKEMKVKAVTLTGKSLMVYVQHDATIRTLKVKHLKTIHEPIPKWKVQ